MDPMYAVDFIKERPILGYGLGGDFYEMYYKALEPYRKIQKMRH